jgi:hypothetical protein
LIFLICNAPSNNASLFYEFCYGLNGSVVALLPFFAKSVIKFYNIPKIAFRPSSLVFCSNDEKSVISCLNFIIDKEIFSFQYIVFNKVILNIRENSFVTLYSSLPLNSLFFNIFLIILNLIFLLLNSIKKILILLNNINQVQSKK